MPIRTLATAGTILFILTNAPQMSAQSQPPLAFEVASVKPHKADDGRPSMPGFLPGGRFVSKGIPLKFLIAVAYNVGYQSVRLSGGPGWINSGEGAYDIEAKAGPDANPPGTPGLVRAERMRLMLQALLADRFKLKIHRETKELPIYAVILGKNGPKLEKAKIEEKDCPEGGAPGVACHSFLGGRGRGLHGEAVSLADVLSYVENWTDRPLVDKTGVQGLFNVQTRGWQPSQPGPAPAPGAKAEDGGDLADLPTLFTLFTEMGLKLDAQKGTVDIFVIDHVEKPTEN